MTNTSRRRCVNVAPGCKPPAVGLTHGAQPLTVGGTPSVRRRSNGARRTLALVPAGGWLMNCAAARGCRPSTRLSARSSGWPAHTQAAPQRSWPRPHGLASTRVLSYRARIASLPVVMFGKPFISLHRRRGRRRCGQRARCTSSAHVRSSVLAWCLPAWYGDFVVWRR